MILKDGSSKDFLVLTLQCHALFFGVTFVVNGVLDSAFLFLLSLELILLISKGLPAFSICLVVKIMVPFWVP